MNEARDAALDKAVQFLKSKGVTGIKVEMEAQLRRSRVEQTFACRNCEDRGTVVCRNCDGDGEESCDECYGDGCSNCSDTGEVTCTECDGRCTRQCNYCDGVPRNNGTTNWRSEAQVLEHILTQIAAATDTTYTPQAVEIATNGIRISQSAHNPFSWMKFARFYNDGSVDSEMTFTIPIDNIANVRHLPAVLRVFRQLESHIGQGFDTRGAGLHMALLFSSDCSYPHPSDNYTRSGRPDSNRLPEQHIENFKRSMTQLLPALYFLSSPDGGSRGIHFRLPQVSMDYRNDQYGNNKYSAISYRSGAIEFRTFDTCYDAPDTILDNIMVMANCMKYMSSTYKNPGVDKIAKELRFGSDDDNTLTRFYRTEMHLDVLKAGLLKLKPSYLTLKEVKARRNFKVTKAGLKYGSKQQVEAAKAAYKEYADRYKRIKEVYMQEVRSRRAREVLERLSPSELRTSNISDIYDRVSAITESQVAQYLGSFEEEDSFVRHMIDENQRKSEGEFILRFAS